MVSFSCENCGDVLTKKKLDPHRNQCRGASFTCLDCMVNFGYGTDYRSHTSCISEAQKYQGHLYRGDKENKKTNKRKSIDGNHISQTQTMVPKRASVEDAPDSGEESHAVAIVDVPPRAPTPPQLEESYNVFDYLVSEPAQGKTVAGAPEPRMLAKENSQYSLHSNGNGSQYLQHGYSYGSASIPPALDRYDSWQNMSESQQSHSMRPPITTPGPKAERKDRHREDKSDKKRKRQHVDDLDLSSAKRPSSRDSMIVDPPTSNTRALHSGLTGGLSRLVTDPEFYGDRIDAGPTPISPIKRSKHDKELRSERRKSSYTSHGTIKSTASKQPDERHRPRPRRDSSSDDGRRRISRTEYRAIEYPDRATSVQPTATNQIIQHWDKAQHFLSFIKGPDSERGCSINKALKRYHRERDVRGEQKDEEDKELFKSLRLRRNDRGEIVLFV